MSSNVVYLAVDDPEATFGFGSGADDDVDESTQKTWGCQELEIRYGADGSVTIFFCPERGVRDGSDGTNNGSDVAQLTLSRVEAARLAAYLGVTPKPAVLV